MKALVVGAGGQLGRELLARAPVGWHVEAAAREALDVTDAQATRRAVAACRPAVVVNAAGYTAVDRAESEREEAFAVNDVGAGNLARAAREAGARLLHVSTDFVFDGRAGCPYRPGDPANPLGTYGASKAAGERRVLDASGGDAIVVRTAWLYSAHGSNFVRTMLGLMATRDEVRVVADQVGTPTWAPTLADALWRLAALDGARGIFHCTDAGVASWYDLAVAIQEEALTLGVLDRTVPVRPVATREYPTPAARPAYSVLDKSDLWAATGETPAHWRVSLRRMLQGVARA